LLAGVAVLAISSAFADVLAEETLKEVSFAASFRRRGFFRQSDRQSNLTRRRGCRTSKRAIPNNRQRTFGDDVVEGWFCSAVPQPAAKGVASAR
jgi:hypothetical protein